MSLIRCWLIHLVVVFVVGMVLCAAYEYATHGADMAWETSKRRDAAAAARHKEAMREGTIWIH